MEKLKEGDEKYKKDHEMTSSSVFDNMTMKNNKVKLIPLDKVKSLNTSVDFGRITPGLQNYNSSFVPSSSR